LVKGQNKSIKITTTNGALILVDGFSKLKHKSTFKLNYIKNIIIFYDSSINYVKVILYSYLIPKNMNERITDS